MTEKELIKGVLNGETNCFEQLVFSFEKPLMRFLVLRCHCLSDAEDAFQETFLNAHLYLHSYDNRFAFSTWLFNIALNIIKKHNRTIKEIYNNETDVAVADTSLIPKNNIWSTAKQHLNDEQLNLIWFTYAEDYSGKDVAIILERSLPWVKINLIRVKRLLKAKLIEKGFLFSDLVRG